MPRRLADGTTVWVGLISDIADLVLPQPRRRDREQTRRRIFDHLPIPVGCNQLDPADTIVFLNRRFTELHGYDRQELPTIETWAERCTPIRPIASR